MVKRPQFTRYNDGAIYIYREKEKRNEFGAKLNTNRLADMDFIVRLSYAEQSKREQDMEYAEQQGFSLEYKVKTRFIKGIDNKCKAVIDGYLYDVRYVDATKTDLYIYLEGVGKLAAND